MEEKIETLLDEFITITDFSGDKNIINVKEIKYISEVKDEDYNTEIHLKNSDEDIIYCQTEISDIIKLLRKEY